MKSAREPRGRHGKTVLVDDDGQPLTTRRSKTKRPLHQRCPRCKKLRRWWVPGAERPHWSKAEREKMGWPIPEKLPPERYRWGRVDGMKACWLCVKRRKEGLD